MIGFIAPYTFTQFGTTGNTVLSLYYTLPSSPLLTHYDSQSSLVVSWQRIYNSLTVTSNHTWSLLVTVLLIYCHYSAAANSEDSAQFNSSATELISRKVSVSKLDFALSTTVLQSFYFLFSTTSRLPTVPFITPRHGPHGKHRLLLLRMRVYWSVTYQWMSACRVRVCCGNVFTESLSSSGYTRSNFYYYFLVCNFLARNEFNYTKDNTFTTR
jgi:hypothetical protein